MNTADGNAFAALIAELEKRLRINGSSQFLVFPEFTFRVALNELLFDAQEIQATIGLAPEQAQREALLNLENFSILANRIPQVSGRFNLNATMLWSVFERVINFAQLATPSLGSDSQSLNIALVFQKARTDFGLSALGSVAPDGANYYPAIALPPNDVSDDDAWTHIRLDKETIDQRSQEVSPEAQEWLRERSLLDDAQGSSVIMKSLSIEVFPLTLRRAWFDPALFQSRAWKWNDEPLSDGGDPPKGLLTAYIVQMILARKLEINLDLELGSPQLVAPKASSPEVTTNPTTIPPTATFGGLDMQRLRLFGTTVGKFKPT